jgi:hypothetical protein
VVRVRKPANKDSRIKEQLVKHGFSEEEWDDFLTGRNAPELRVRIDAHLVGCQECWQLYQEQALAMRHLAEAAAQAREQLALSDEELQTRVGRLMASFPVLEPALENDLAAPAQIRSGLEFLKSLLIPVFGPKAAQRAMGLAASGSAAGSLDRMTRESWAPFLERLAAITSVICGDVFAGLIREHGRLATVPY